MTLVTIYACDRCGCDIRLPEDRLFTIEMLEPNAKPNIFFFAQQPLHIRGDMCKLCTVAMVIEYNKWGIAGFEQSVLKEVEEHEEEHRKEWVGEPQKNADNVQTP